MPKIPKWIGDSMETIFSSMIYPVGATHIEWISDSLKRVRFEGNLTKTQFTAGNVVEFRVDDTNFRHYTPSFYNIEKGIFEVLFYLHNKGAGSDWARQLEVGSETKLMGPGGRLKYNANSKYHFFFGDETSLGLFVCLKEKVEEHAQEYLCFVELDDANKSWPASLNLSADVVHKTFQDPAKESIAQLDEMQGKCWNVWQHATFYLTGNAKSIQAFRKALTSRGVKSRQIQTEAYWAEGKKGL